MSYQFPEIKQAIDQTLQSIDAFKQTQGRRVDELTSRLEAIEGKGFQGDRPGAIETKAAAQHLLAFKNWVRKPHDSHTISMLGKAEAEAFEQKDVTIGSQSGGGYAVPMQIYGEIEKRLNRMNVLRDLVKVVPASTSDFKALVSINSATSGWVGETGTRAGTATPTLRERKPTHGELYAYPQVSEWSLDDIMFDVVDWLSESVAEDFAEREADAIIRGNGVNKPTGILNSAPTAVTDDAGSRAPDVIEYVPSGHASQITADGLIDLVFRVKSQYLNDPRGVAWLMSRNAMASVAKLKDSTGQYLLQPAISESIPARLLGYPVRSADGLDPVAAGNHPVLFGNFRRGYMLVERGPARITVDQLTNVGHVKFYVRRRLAGIVLNNDAIKALKIGTS
nr:phage major capsid protein [Variovorax boronicumulans]